MGNGRRTVMYAASLIGAGLFVGVPGVLQADPPSSFDLRDVHGTNYTTSVKSQSGGTCWTHGTMAAIESNLKMSRKWNEVGETNEPNLAEYHLDWWSGFNDHNNDDRDPPAGGGLEVHQGGDYLVASAYMSRGEGAVYCPDANDDTERDDNWYAGETRPDRTSTNFDLYYPRHVEWYVAGPGLAGINAIKTVIMQYGAIGTCMYWGGGFFNSGSGSHYQPPSDANDPNHSIAIVGWDDDKETLAPTNGAWLCKNSWGGGWNGDGHFWISYYDKHCGQQDEMGAVSFREVVPVSYNNVYYHDYHGWRDTMATSTAFNAFAAVTTEVLVAVSFYTSADDVEYAARIYDRFEDGRLQGQRASVTGALARTGFHTVDLATPLSLTNGQSFFIFLSLSSGGQAFDRTSTVDVLLDDNDLLLEETAATAPPYEPSVFEIEGMGKMKMIAKGTEVVSSAAAGESYYMAGTNWTDLTEFNGTGNFCIKGLTENSGPPFVGITNADVIVNFEVDSYIVAGTNNAHVHGAMSVSNAANGVVLTFPAATEWTTPAVSLEEGDNLITVRGASAFGDTGSDTISIRRRMRPVSAIFITDLRSPMLQETGFNDPEHEEYL